MLFVIATQVTQENRQDSASEIVSLMQGNQQAHIHYPTYPNVSPHIPAPPPPPPSLPPLLAYWSPEIGWWACYPMAPYLTHDPNYYPHYLSHFHAHNNDGYNLFDSNKSVTKISMAYNNNSRASELCDRNSAECMIADDGNHHSGNYSTFYVGPRWRNESSTTPTSCTTTTTERSDKLMEERGLRSSSAVSSLSTEADDCENGEDEGSYCHSSKANDDKNNEEDYSTETSNSNCDSDSYLAYSIGLNPINKFKAIPLGEELQKSVANKNSDDNNSTDCEKDISMEDDEDTREYQVEEEEDERTEKACETIEQEDMSNTTVSVSLPLKIRFSVSEKNEDVTTVIVGDSTIRRNVDTCVDFTLKRLNKQVETKTKETQEVLSGGPVIVVTPTDEDDQARTSEESATIASNSRNVEDEKVTLLNIRGRLKEEVTDDEDSGVTSDTSRIISEVDTDSELCLTNANVSVIESTRNQNKYQRAQTHSRLFKLLNDDRMKLTKESNGQPSKGGNSSNSSELTSPDCSFTAKTTNQYSDLGTSTYQTSSKRPKSLDCEALFKRYQDYEEDFYYQTWKNGDRSQRRLSVITGIPRTYPRSNVICPRTKSSKNIPNTLNNRQQQQRQSCMQFPIEPTVISSSRIPNPMTVKRRC